MRLPFSLILLALTSLTTAQGDASAAPSLQASDTSTISAALDPSFAGLGIEPSNLYSFTGGAQANQLSINLLQNLADYAGAPPHLRIGGNTQDYMIYDSSYTNFNVENTADPTGQGDSDIFTIGPGYFEALDRFPQGTPITYGLNLAYSLTDWNTRIVDTATAAVTKLSNVKLVSFEIGNEPDLYHENNIRDVSYAGPQYTSEWLARADQVWTKVLQPAGIPSKFFEPAATASTDGTTFDINSLIKFGITAGSDNADTFVFGWNQHDYYYFTGVTNYGLTIDHMLQLQTTEDQFAYWTTQVDAANKSSLPYYLREMSSAGPTGLQNISDSFAGALWTLNFFCYAASIGIASVEMHMTDNSYASPWQPININNQSPHVRPNYYAFAAVAQLIGSGNGTSQIAKLPLTSVTSAYTAYVKAYSYYRQGQLAGFVLINGKTSNTTDTSKSMNFSLSLPNNFANQKLWLQYMSSTGASATSGVTWNGVSFEQTDDGTPQTVKTTTDTLDIGSDGKVTVSVPDSQAIVATINFGLGGVNTAIKKSDALARSQGSVVLICISIVMSFWVCDWII
ncbi:hypothetical protein BT63DRAFT_374839 [Microthyrium microscopicum]|uniref:Beta-glucuronidase C-terminal domain-containing protein n=1 Tax=Microthyrium microscopicum TaxID=703497 RepID=A0A6A6U800_9PEZI|nr:hypothetical protein BT63DRAFT_374839 [Microthyrium microscopicum]